MELVKLGQLHKAASCSKELKAELANKLSVLNYCIPDNTFKNLENKAYNGYNCLHLAAMNLDFNLVCTLLKRGVDFLKQGTQDLRTPLHVAVNAKTNYRGKRIWEMNGILQECLIVNVFLLAHVRVNNTFNAKCKDGISHFHVACMFNCVETVRFYLQNGEDVNQVTSAAAPWSSCTPLHFAMRYSSLETAEILLANRANLFAKNAEGISPLQILIDRLLNIADYMTMGQYALSSPFEEEFKRLETITRIVIKLKGGGGMSVLDDTGLTTFHIACLLKNSSIVERFLNGNLDLNMPIKTNSKFWPGWTPLHFAACSNPTTVQLLMEKGADITIKNKRGETPLDMCLKRYPPRVVHSILSTRHEFKSILLSDNSTKLLDLILAMNDIATLLYFLENLYQLDISINPTSPLLPGYGILHLATSMNERMLPWEDFIAETDTESSITTNFADDESLSFPDRIRACLSMGCSVNLKNLNGLTPIHLAFKTHLIRSDILGELLNYCHEDIIDPDGLSHLHIACAFGHQAAMRNLLNSGANIQNTTRKSLDWYKKPFFGRFSVDVAPKIVKVNANSTPLHFAVTFEYAAVVDVLLNNFADPLAKDAEGYTPIHLAMGSNHIAKFIIGKPENLVDMVTKEGLSHLHVAAFCGRVDAVRKLICDGANSNGRISDVVPEFLSGFGGKTPLQIAIGNDRTAVVEALIKFGADVYANDTLQCLMLTGESDFEVTWHVVNILRLKEDVKKPIDSSGLTLLHVACSRYDVNWATNLLNNGADVNARIRDDEDYKGSWKGYTPLHVLVNRKNISNDSVVQSMTDELGRMLLKFGADVTINSEDGTPLHMVHREYLRMRDEKEAHKDSPQRGRSLPSGLLLELASRQLQDLVQGQHQQESLLFEPVQRRLEMEQLDRRLGLPENITHGSLASSMLCRQSNFQINPISPDGFSHFHFFCTIGKEEIVRKYLDSGVNINHSTNPFIENFAGFTALHFAIKYKAFNVADLLVERGADVNVENTDGNTPLHLVILYDSIDARRTFIESMKSRGANFNVKNLKGETPLDVLMTKRNFNVEQLEYLLTNGSTINFNKSRSILGPAALIMQNATIEKRIEILKIFFDICNIRLAVKNGYNPIQDIVKAKINLQFLEGRDKLRGDDYLDIIMELMRAGCEVDKPDDEGCTALHHSITLENVDAVRALVQLGADLNACRVESSIFQRSGSKFNIEKCLAFQVHKMYTLGLDVTARSNSIYVQCNNAILIAGDLEMSVAMELERAEMIKFNKFINARSFLSELNAVVHYHRLLPAVRESIDVFFNNYEYLLEQFPVLCGLLLSQYKKAVVRPRLMTIAKDVLASDCNVYLPDLCWDRLSSYMSNEALKYMIEHSSKVISLLDIFETY